MHVPADEDFEINDLESQAVPQQVPVDSSMANNGAAEASYAAEAGSRYQQNSTTRAVDDADSNMQEHLPPIDSDNGRKAEKARLKQEKLQAELAALKAMSLDNKIALLKKYVP